MSVCRFLLLLITAILMKLSVNVSARCTLEKSGLKAHCNNGSFTDINLPANITDIEFVHVQGQIEDEYFSKRPTIQKLVVINGEIALKDGSFKGLYNLKHLKLTNTNIDRIPRYSLVYLSKLETFDWSNNQIQNVSTDTFRYNTQLQRLDLSGNLLKHVDAAAFHGLSSLHELLLNNCQLQSLDLRLLTGLSQLHGLNVSHNAITSINVSADNSTLSWLDLSSNRLAEIAELSLSQFRSLHWLDLSDNQLLSLPVLPQSITELRLSHNSFIVANHTALPLPASLQRLRLEHCDNLVRIDRNFFSHTPHVRSVNITNNQHLSVIEHAVFQQLANLTQLDISSNQLHQLPRSLRELSESTDMQLAGNNLSCDCSVTWLRQREPPALESQVKCWWKGSRRDLRSLNDTHECPGAGVTVRQRHVWVDYNSSAVLTCHVTPAVEYLTWITPENLMLHWQRDNTYTPPPHHPDSHTSDMRVDEPRLLNYRVLEDGRLQVDATRHAQRGRHVCIAENAVSTASGAVLLTVGVGSLHDIKMTTLLLALIGCVAAISFALIVRLALFIFYQCGCCPCCNDEPPPRTKRLKKVLDSVEQWRAQQLLGLRENYAQQVAGIKESCYQQVGRIRETYKGQVRCLGDMRDYGAQQIDGLREQYLDQVKRVREYSLSQMNRVHENYIFQRNRIRKYSGHQLVRLRETAKYQQRALNKLMETLPELYLQNCRTGGQQPDNDLFPWYDYESPQHVVESSRQLEGQSRADARLETVVVIEMEDRAYYHRSSAGLQEDEDDEEFSVRLTLEEHAELDSPRHGAEDHQGIQTLEEPAELQSPRNGEEHSQEGILEIQTNEEEGNQDIQIPKEPAELDSPRRGAENNHEIQTLESPREGEDDIHEIQTLESPRDGEGDNDVIQTKKSTGDRQEDNHEIQTLEEASELEKPRNREEHGRRDGEEDHQEILTASDSLQTEVSDCLQKDRLPQNDLIYSPDDSSVENGTDDNRKNSPERSFTSKRNRDGDSDARATRNGHAEASRSSTIGRPNGEEYHRTGVIEVYQSPDRYKQPHNTIEIQTQSDTDSEPEREIANFPLSGSEIDDNLPADASDNPQKGSNTSVPSSGTGQLSDRAKEDRANTPSAINGRDSMRAGTE